MDVSAQEMVLFVSQNKNYLQNICFLLSGTIEEKKTRITLNTASFVDPNGVFEWIAEIRKDDRFAYASLIATIYKTPPPAVQIS